MRKLMRNRKAMAWVVLLTFLFTSIMPTGSAFADATAETLEQTAQRSAQVVSQGGYNPIDETMNADGVSISKILTPTGTENYFDITLQVQTTESIEKLMQTESTAVVVVMDISNTMNTGNKIGEAKTAAADFIRSYCTNEKLGTDRKIGLVTFNRDAKAVFGLESATDAAINTLTTKVNNINAPSETEIKWTNIEGGLQLAANMLGQSSAKHKYVILLTDGFPTTYIKSARGSLSEITGYTPITTRYSDNKTPGHDGVFWNQKTNLNCSGYTDYTDKGADRAINVAESLKTAGVDIFTVGIGIHNMQLSKTGSNDTTSYEALDESRVGYSTIDCYPNNANNTKKAYVIENVTAPSGNPNGGNTAWTKYEAWLATKIGSGTDKYTRGNSQAALNQMFNDTLTAIETANRTAVEDTWKTVDPMGPNTEFLYFYNKAEAVAGKTLTGVYNAETKRYAENTANYTESAGIDWNILKSEYTTDTSENTTIYTYSLKYRVRLQNENDVFVENTANKTNGNTDLKYKVNENGTLTEEKTLDFPEPSVKGYLADLTFKKVDSNTNEGIAGVTFTLTHADNCAVCKNAEHNVKITKKTATSDDYGTVSFKDIPSGHNYVLTETAPTGYIAGGPWNVNVAYNQITVVTVDGNEVTDTIANTPETINISGKKVWVDDDNKAGERPESITVRLEGVESNYTTSQVITLADDWKYEFKDLPKYHNGQKVNYIITEDKVEGYQTVYDVDTYDITNIKDDHQSLFTNVPVTKVWDDNNDELNKRPDSIQLQLKVNGIATGSAITLLANGTDTWNYTFENLPKYDADGKTNVYTVEELNVPEGYVSAAVATMNGVNITNKLYAGDEGEFSVSKKVEGDKAPADDAVYDFELEVTAEHQDWSALLVHNRNELKAENEKALAAQATAQDALDEAATLFKANAKAYSTGSAYTFVMKAESSSPSAYRYTFIEKDNETFAKTTVSAYDFFGLAEVNTASDSIIETIAETIKELATEFATIANPVNFLEALRDKVALGNDTAVEFNEADAETLLVAAGNLFDADRHVEATSAAMLEFEENVPTTTSAITLVMTPKDGTEKTLSLLPENAVNGVYIIPFSLTKDMEYNFAIKATTGTSIQYVVKEVGYPTADYLYTMINGVKDADRATEENALANNSIHSHYMFTNVYDKKTTPPEDPWTPPYVPPTDPTDPPVVIDDPETPLADTPEEVEIVEPGVPLADVPEEEIIEEPVPLGDAPPTGDTNNAIPFVVLMMAAVAGLVVTRRKFN